MTTLCTLNLNGIRAAGKRGFGRWLKRTAPDTLCLQELRAWPEQVGPEVVSPAGYNARWVTAQKKGYSGVALYSKAAVDAYAVGSGLEWGDEEGRVLRGDYDDHSIVSLYIPSGSSGEQRQAKKFEYLEHIAGYLRPLARSRRAFAVCGDFNIAHTEIDIHAPKRNVKNSGFLPAERAWLTELLKQGWVDVVRQFHPDEVGLYSWWSNRGRARENDLGWRLDYVLMNKAFAKRATGAWIEKRAGLSDHAPVWVEFD
jgi:exodeoxyribonuclease-3